MSLITKALLMTCLLASSAVLATDDWQDDSDDWGDEESISNLQLNGFIEVRSGIRLQGDTWQRKNTIDELRLKAKVSQAFENISFKFNADFIADRVAGQQPLNLQQGEGFMDLRELHFSVSPSQNIDLKIGRQILTWGTGDLVFINDLFSKDWRSFFNGRDTQYLKAPSDAIKASIYFDSLNLDTAYIPRYNSDRFIDGQRLSYQDANTQQLQTQRPSSRDELSLRAYRTIDGIEAALYYYTGYSKSPAGLNQVNNKAIFPQLAVYGASIRSPFAKGIFNAEIGYHHLSTPTVSQVIYSKTSQWRGLIGYEQELAKELTASFQYYVEVKKEKPNRHLTTIRLQKQLMQQKLQLAAFNFYSPTDKDGYLRLNASYKYTDNIKIELGGNVFYGHDQQGFFSQFKDNNNVYASFRLSY